MYVVALLIQHFTKDWAGHWMVSIISGSLPLQGLVLLGLNPGVALYSLSLRGIITHIMAEGPHVPKSGFDGKNKPIPGKNSRDTPSLAPLSSRDRKTDALAREFCSVCSLWKSENTVHCPVANVCVKNYKGYSDLLGLPIGKYNHRLLLMMLVSGVLTLLVALTLICLPIFSD